MLMLDYPRLRNHGPAIDESIQIVVGLHARSSILARVAPQVVMVLVLQL